MKLLNTVARRERGFVSGSLVIWLVAAALAGLVAWANLAQVDVVARATGTVIASSRVQVIQSVDGGVLSRLPVREGDRVRRGQVLASFDEARTRAQLVEMEARRAGLLANVTRLRAELADRPIDQPSEVRRFPQMVKAQEALMAGRRANLRADLRALEDVVRLAREELVITERLTQAGDASQIELLRAQRQLTDAQSRLATRRNQYVQDCNAELTRALEELEQVEQQANQRRKMLDNVVITSPSDGIVKNVRFTTLGAVLRAGDELMSVVPVDDEMIIEARVSPRDIALVRSGLEAIVKFDAYDYTVFGAVDARVSYVGPDSIRDETARGDAVTYYRVHVVTKSPALTRAGKQIDVIPGMTASLDIRAGSRSVMQFLLKPITRTFGEAFRER